MDRPTSEILQVLCSELASAPMIAAFAGPDRRCPSGDRNEHSISIWPVVTIDQLTACAIGLSRSPSITEKLTPCSASTR